MLAPSLSPHANDVSQEAGSRPSPPVLKKYPEPLPKEVFDVVVCTWASGRLLRCCPQHIHTYLVLKLARLLTSETSPAVPKDSPIFGFLSPDQPFATRGRDDLTSLLTASSSRIAGPFPGYAGEAPDDLWRTIPQRGHVYRSVRVVRPPSRQ